MSDSEASRLSRKDEEMDDSRYVSPVFTNTQLDALMGTQEALGNLPEMEMNLDDSEEEEEEDFTNLPLYDENLDDSDISEFELPSESENEARKVTTGKRKSDTHAAPEEETITSPLVHRPAPKKSAMKSTSQTEAFQTETQEPEISRMERRRSKSRSRAASTEVLEDPAITARRLRNFKREAPRPPLKETPAEKRRRLDPDNQYRLLLNRQIDEAASPPLGRGDWKLRRTQIGSSLWRKHEKAKLYVALQRVGKHDVKAIAEFIGTKNQYEVMEYIKLFEEEIKALEEGEKRRGEHRVEETEVPAAVEVSLELEAILEEAANKLGRAQDLKDMKRQKREWGRDAWQIGRAHV